MHQLQSIYDLFGDSMKYLKAWVATFGIFLTLNVFSQTSLDFGDDKYQPRLGQEGKDVIWLPTENKLVTLMLKTAKVTPNDLVYDLGAGDGKIAIAAAKEFGARAVGIEFNADMAALAQRNAIRAGVGDRVKIINGDIFKEDFSKATVLTLYLLPELNMQLRPTILKMKPGTRVVSHAFSMGDWYPDAEFDSPAISYYWVVPAPIDGVWTISGMEPQNKVTLKIAQLFQDIGGILQIGESSQPILSPKLNGAKLSFSYIDRNKNSHKVSVTIDNNEFKGIDKIGGFFTSEIIGKRN